MGAPERIEVGNTSVRGLAKEADVPLNWLNRQYVPEKVAFEAAVRGATDGPLTAREAELAERVAELEAEVKRLRLQSVERRDRGDAWKVTAEHFIREVALVKTELVGVEARRTAAFKARDNLKAAQEAVDQLHAYEAERTPVTTFKPRVIGPDDTA